MRGKAEFRPNPSPSWVKESLAEDLADHYERVGILPDSRAIEEEVGEDLRRYDARKREGASSSSIRTPAEVARTARTRELARRGKVTREDGERALAAAERIREHPEAIARTDAIHNRAPCACGGATCKPCRLKTRLVALLARGELCRNHGGFLFPRQAGSIVDAFAAHRFRRRNYRGLTDADAERALKRELEDIADSTNLILGDWRG